MLKHDFLSSFPVFLPSPPCQLPCTSSSCGCWHLQFSNCVSETSLFFPDWFPWLPLSHEELKSFDSCWMLNFRRSFCLVCRISHSQEFRYCKVKQTLTLETKFKWSYFKPMYTLLTRRCPLEQEEFVFWKNQIRLIRLSFRLSLAWDFYLLTKPTSSTGGSLCPQLN